MTHDYYNIMYIIWITKKLPKRVLINQKATSGSHVRIFTVNSQTWVLPADFRVDSLSRKIIIHCLQKRLLNRHSCYLRKRKKKKAKDCSNLFIYFLPFHIFDLLCVNWMFSYIQHINMLQFSNPTLRGWRYTSNFMRGRLIFPTPWR